MYVQLSTFSSERKETARLGLRCSNKDLIETISRVSLNSLNAGGDRPITVDLFVAEYENSLHIVMTSPTDNRVQFRLIKVCVP